MAFKTFSDRYCNSCSLIHLLDARTKLFALVVYVVSVFIADCLHLILFPALFLTVVFVLSKVSFSYVIKGIKTVLFIVVFTCAVSILIDKSSYRKIVFSSLKVTEVLIASNIFVLTTKADDITDAIEKIIEPLKVFKIPVSDIAFTISIAIRFIPIVESEAEKIVLAQKSRGLNLQKNGIINKAKSVIAIIIPVFESVLNKADTLACAMDSRMYGYKKRTRINNLCYSYLDLIAYIVVVIYFATVILMRFF